MNTAPAAPTLRGHDGGCPEMELDRIDVEVPSKAIPGMHGIKQIQSTGSEGMGTVMIDLGADARRVVDEVESKMNSITTLPIETEKPIIRELTNRAQVVDIAVSGDIDPFTLQHRRAGPGRADRDSGGSRRPTS